MNTEARNNRGYLPLRPRPFHAFVRRNPSDLFRFFRDLDFDLDRADRRDEINYGEAIPVRDIRAIEKVDAQIAVFGVAQRDIHARRPFNLN